MGILADCARRNGGAPIARLLFSDYLLPFEALSVLLLAGVSLAAGPGGPLYGVRLWAETISLPSEPDARADADVDRLDARVDEAVDAARDGNGSAVSAALAAYRDILQDALDAAGQGNAADDRLQGAIDRHRIIFAALLENAPDPAKPAIEGALEKSDEAAKGLSDANGNSGGDKPAVRPTPRPGGGHGPDATPKGGPEKSPPGRPSSGKPGG